MLQEILQVSDHNTEIQLFDSAGRSKNIWCENKLGRYLRKSGREVRLPGVTGAYGKTLRNKNLVTNVGHALAAGRIGGLGSYSPAIYLAIGVTATAATVTDTALGSETTTVGGARALATATQVTGSVANDTLQLVHTWTFSGSLVIVEEGIFDAASSGNLVAHQVFAAINVASGDSLQITHTLKA